MLLLGGFAGYETEFDNWQGVLWIQNQSSRIIVIDSGEIVFRTSSDAVIETDFFFQRVLYPGVNYIGINLFDPAASPELIDVNYDEADFFDAGKFAVSNVTVEVGRYGTVEVSGEISSNFSEDMDFVELLYVFFDEAGNPLFADQQFVDRVESGGTTLFNESTYLDDRAPTWDYIEVYAQP